MPSCRSSYHNPVIADSWRDIPARTSGKCVSAVYRDRGGLVLDVSASNPTLRVCGTTGTVSAGYLTCWRRHSVRMLPTGGHDAPVADWWFHNRSIGVGRVQVRPSVAASSLDRGSRHIRRATSCCWHRACSPMSAAKTRDTRLSRSYCAAPLMAGVRPVRRMYRTTRLLAGCAGHDRPRVGRVHAATLTGMWVNRTHGRTWPPYRACVQHHFRRRRMTLSCMDYTTKRGM